MGASAQSSRFSLPGFTLPLRFIPNKNLSHEPTKGGLLRNALDCDDYNGELVAQMPMTTIREFTMLRLMNELTDKPGWETKVFDDSIANKWKTEAMSTPGADVTESMANYAIEELRHKAGVFHETGSINVYAGDVVKSDCAVPESLREQLKTYAARLEDVPDVRKDYHPRSDGLVLDLVHPSLFPLIYGRTRILPDSLTTLENCIDKCGEGITSQVTPEDNSPGWDDSFSRHFQWLPCEVEFLATKGATQKGSQPESRGTDERPKGYPECKITSYINNLHPHYHADLYGCIEGIIARVIPQWNRTLGPLERDNHEEQLRIRYLKCILESDPDPLKSPKRAEDESDDDYKEKMDEWYERLDNRKPILPEPGEFKGVVDNEEYDLQEKFGSRGLQVIVKLANIHLTPEKPEYRGGSWHIEGQMNEHICATALYYYDSENITESRLAFRQRVSVIDTGVNYEQDFHEWIEDVFGCDRDGPPIQEVGDVVCKQGRLITFPNVLQHQVQPFRLQDASRPGHRKILALFLVDPNIRVISTVNVPPQQRGWWGEKIRSIGPMKDLPAELQDEVIEGVDDFPISMEEAKKARRQLMDERSDFVMDQTEAFTWGRFKLCEH